MKNQFRINIYHSIKFIDKEKYNRIVDLENPFLEYEFLEALEESGCVGPRTTWHPRYIVLTDEEKIIGAITFYIKYDSYGEYIFDWEWARAYQNARLRYYPKALVAIPFTPANGTRILVDSSYSSDECAGWMAKYLIEFCSQENLSSIHFLFLTEKEQLFLEKLGFLSRKTHQYHWKNRNYETFNDFLDDLRSNRKKQIRKERKSIEQSELDIKIIEKNDIQRENIDAIWKFYMDTHSRKWVSPYLNRRFFDLIFKNFRPRLVTVLAKEKNNWVGGTFNIVKNNRLFGRYWGCTADYANLHFECCFYRLIDYAIENKIDIFEAGAQGEHKFLRGFAAVPTYSSHFIFHEGGRTAIEDYLIREREHTTRLINDFNKQSPLKYLNGRSEK
ncbi:MAG: GNAT family N-acetyltransferase [Deltaproteobacteria bacterium]|nr:GNAT family N-acetyltransferase [Deltaproteobacteria bacterium]